MIIIRTPFRVSFFGGGSDYPAHYEKSGGQVLTATINKYAYICLREMPNFLGTKYRIFWSHMETVNTIEEIKHPGVKACLSYLKIDKGIEVNHAGDLPARSGLGSSSSFTVGMLHALHVLQNDPVTKHQLAMEAIDVEQNVMKETVGIQDQIQCAWGGVNYITINREGEYLRHPITLDSSFEKHLVLVYTGKQRFASDIATEQVNNMDKNSHLLERIVGMVQPAVDAMVDKQYQLFGEMLDETWRLKRELSDKISTPEIDELYNTGIQLGAWGGKVLGAGGGGFMLFMLPADRREMFIQAMSNNGHICAPVEFEYGGTQLVIK